MNPFMTGQPAGMGGGMGQNPFAQDSYTNPNHNKNPYMTGFGGEERKGPSNESWSKDVNDFGFNVQLDVKKNDSAKNDNIKEFKDLFDLGNVKI